MDAPDSVQEIAASLAELGKLAAVRAALVAVEGAQSMLERHFAALPGPPTYIDSIVGTRHSLDTTLPARALASVSQGLKSGVLAPSPELVRAYREPLAAMQDDDLELPEPIALAFYAVYNLYGATAAEGEGSEVFILLSRAVHQALAARRMDNPADSEPSLSAWRAAALRGS